MHTSVYHGYVNSHICGCRVLQAYGMCAKPGLAWGTAHQAKIFRQRKSVRSMIP